jgi:uncharacterized membrane protein
MDRESGATAAVVSAVDDRSAPGFWLRTLRRFLVFSAGANLVWELAQLPLYTVWYDGTPGEIAFAVAHCTGGDILIAGASLLLALLVAARPTWPHETYRRVAALTVAFAVPYTVFSEWLNTEVRGSWAYSELMPVLPVLDAGLSPLAQWIVIPLAAFWWARRPLPAGLPPSAGHAGRNHASIVANTLVTWKC